MLPCRWVPTCVCCSNPLCCLRPVLRSPPLPLHAPPRRAPLLLARLKAGCADPEAMEGCFSDSFQPWRLGWNSAHVYHDPA